MIDIDSFNIKIQQKYIKCHSKPILEKINEEKQTEMKHINHTLYLELI